MNNSELTDIVGVCLECQDLDTAWKLYKDSNKPYKGLYVEAELTHADKIINRRVYFRDKVAKGAQTFLKPYRKPVLRHHDEEKTDAIGRVVRAEFVDTPHNIGPNLNRFSQIEHPRVREAYFNYLLDNHLLNPEFQGTGYIKGALDITDKKAIERVMDERYLTLSVGFDSNSRRCSFCGHDWVREGRACEHMPGTIEEGIPILHLMGDLYYKEVSFVNSPADSGAVITKIGTDSSNGFCVYNIDTFNERYQYFQDHMEDINMFEEFMAALRAGQKVKVEDFLACEDFSAVEFYKLLDLNEKYRLAEETLSTLADAAFCHAGNVLPMVDKAHFDAAKKFLQSCEETPGKQRLTNRIYYLARKLSLLPTTNVALEMDNGVTFNISNEDAVLASYSQMKEQGLFDTLTDALKQEFESRLKVLNLDYGALDAELAKVVESQEVTEPPAEENQDAGAVEPEGEPAVEPQATEGSQDAEPKKGPDANELYTMFMNLDEGQQEEFRSLTDIHAQELLTLNDMVEDLRSKVKVATEDSVKIKAEATQTAEKLARATDSLIETIIDYRAVLEKPGAAEREKNREELKKRSFDSLLDTLADLRKEVADSLEDASTVETETDSRRNEEVESDDSAYPAEPLTYPEFVRAFFGYKKRF